MEIKKHFLGSNVRLLKKISKELNFPAYFLIGAEYFPVILFLTM